MCTDEMYMRSVDREYALVASIFSKKYFTTKSFKLRWLLKSTRFRERSKMRIWDHINLTRTKNYQNEFKGNLFLKTGEVPKVVKHVRITRKNKNQSNQLKPRKLFKSHLLWNLGCNFSISVILSESFQFGAILQGFLKRL